MMRNPFAWIEAESLLLLTVKLIRLKSFAWMMEWQVSKGFFQTNLPCWENPQPVEELK